jgi:tetraacyldisaccharide 4'-kinase
VTGAWKAVHRLRARWWLSHARRLPAPTVSVGNLHWGGTGKTPLVAAIARRFLEDGRRVAILSRGYGRRTRGTRIVGRGRGPEIGPAAAGDEPFLLARELPAAYVVVGESRLEAGRRALELTPPPDLFVLDDGFSHLRLARDADLLALPVGDPWGGDRLPPKGRLREPLESSRRAHGVLVTGLEATAERADAIARELARRGFTGRGFAAPTHGGEPCDPDGVPLVPAGPVLLVTGIARPERVRQAAEAQGLTVAEHLAFPDHHDYPPASLARIRARIEASGAVAVLTTAKDVAKLQGRVTAPLAVLPVEARIDPPFWPLLEGLLARAFHRDAAP